MSFSEITWRINNKRKHIENTSHSVNKLNLMRVLIPNKKRTQSFWVLVWHTNWVWTRPQRESVHFKVRQRAWSRFFKPDAVMLDVKARTAFPQSSNLEILKCSWPLNTSGWNCVGPLIRRPFSNKYRKCIFLMIFLITFSLASCIV